MSAYYSRQIPMTSSELQTPNNRYSKHMLCLQHGKKAATLQAYFQRRAVLRTHQHAKHFAATGSFTNTLTPFRNSKKGGGAKQQGALRQ
jgi:hypothetical protein